MNYDKPSQGAVTGDQDGNFVYPSLASEGLTTVTLPIKDPSDPMKQTESIHTADFGLFVVRKVEGQFAKAKGLQYSGFKPSDPAATFAHYAGAAKGAQLLDSDSLNLMGNLAERFAVSSDPQFWADVVRPFLVNLKPQKRG